MRYKIPIKIVELESGNYHLLVESVFADGKKGFWVIDTGASKTVFDKNLSRYFIDDNETGEELHGAMPTETPLESTIGTLGKVRFEKFELKNAKVALLDLDHINALYDRTCGIKICGLLGSDVLVKNEALIDYKRKLLVLKQKA